MVTTKKPRSPPNPAAGRPAKADGDRKDDLIRVRVTAEQKATLTAAAELAGLDVSGWLRFVGLREAQRTTEDSYGKSDA